MENRTSHSKSFKLFVSLGCILLVVMALFHGSGLKFVNDTLLESNSKGFIKDIFPVLFVHTSVHLFSLAIFGIATLSMSDGHKTILKIIASFIIISSLAAFYLTAIAPGILLLLSASCFLIANFKK